jgi:hypothetical protein
MKAVQMRPLRRPKLGLGQQHTHPVVASVIRLDTSTCTSIDAYTRLDLSQSIGKGGQRCRPEHPKARHTQPKTVKETEKLALPSCDLSRDNPLSIPPRSIGDVCAFFHVERVLE